MFQYYNAHPYQRDTDDCVKRAITVAANMTYTDVQRGLNQHKKISGAKDFNSCGNPESYVEKVLGLSRVAVPRKKDGTRMTANEFCLAHPRGRYILSMSGHWTAVINGTILDTWDCGQKGIYSYYAVTPIERQERVPIRYGFIIRRESAREASVSFYDGNGNCSVRRIAAEHMDGYRACLLDMGRHEAVDWNDARWK